MSDDQDRIQLRAAAQGCVSGEAHEWPRLYGLLRRLGYPVNLITPASDLKKMAQDALSIGEQR